MLLFAILAAGILTMWVPARWALTLFELAILGGGAWRVGVRWRSRKPLPADWSILLLLGIAGWGCVQWAAGWTVDLFRTQVEVLNWLVRAAAMFWAMDLEERQIERFMDALVIFGAALSIVAILTLFSSPAGVVFWSVDVGTRLATLGPFVYRNQFAAFVEVVLPVALVRALVDRRRSWWYAGAAGVLAASVVASGSRAGSILCAAELCVVPLLVVSKWHISMRKALLPVAIIGLAVTALVGLVGWGYLADRFAESDPLALRWTLTQSSVEMVRARPLTGFGLGTWSAAYPGFATYDDGTFVNQAHNDWAQWSAEGGLGVLGAMLLFAARLVGPSFAWAPGVGALAVLVHATVDYPLQQRPALGVFFFVFFAIVVKTRALFGQGNPRRLTLSHT